MNALRLLRVAPPAVRTRLAGVGPAGWVGLLLAHAAAVSAVAHCHYFVHPPTRQLWVLLELALSAILWPAGRWYAARVVGPAWAELSTSGKWGFALGTVAGGVVVSQWWAGSLADTLWLFPPAAQSVLQPVLAAAHAVVLAAGYAGLLAVVVRTDPPARPEPPTGSWYPVTAAVTLLLFLAAGNGFAAWFVGREQTVYYHDYCFWWLRSADLASVMRDNPEAAWDVVRRSVRVEDYGLTGAVGPAAVMAAGGGSRLAFVLAVVNLYLVGVVIAGWVSVRLLAPGAGRLAAVLPAVLVLTSTPAWGPLVRGYLEIGGAALGMLAVALYLSRPAGEQRWPRLIAVGALLVAMVLSRRWYGYFAATFFLVAGLEAMAAAVAALARGGGWRAAIGRLRPVVVAGAAAGVVLGSFAAPWAVKVFGKDHAAELGAWKSEGGLAHEAWWATQIVGPGYVVAAAAGFLVLLAFRGGRRPAVYLAAMCPVIGVLFLHVQNLHPHQQYLFLPALVLLPALALTRVLAAVPGWVRPPAVALVGAAGAAAMVVTFVPEAAPWHERLRPAVSAFTYHPLVRDDLPEFRRLLRYLDREAGPTGRVAIVASSSGVNGSTFAAAAPSLGEPLPAGDRYIMTPEVDRVSTFPTGLFEADLVAVADPPQLHLRPAEQQTLIVTTESLLRGEGVGRAFDRLPETFRLTGGATVYVYRRARPIPAADLATFAARLRQAHPTITHLHTPTPAARAGLAFPRAPAGG